MKIIYATLFVSFCLLAFTACNKDEKNNAPESKDVNYRPRPDDVLLVNTDFKVDSPQVVEGQAIVYKNPFWHVLRFENFMVENGPNLKVYLSASIEDLDNYIDLGDLIAASGNFNYTFSVNTDLNLYNYVLVYSEESNSIACYAEL